MKIFLDSKKHIQIQRLEPIFNQSGSFISRDSKNCDVQLSLVYLRHKTKLPITTRLDGIYYDLAIPYRGKNKPISKAHSLSSGIIYQSKSCMIMCEKFLSPRRTKNYDIVYNGIDPNWAGSFIEHEGINIVTSAKWRRFKRLKEIIDLFLDFQKIVPNSKLHILGRLHENTVIKHPNIIYYGMVDFKKMSDIYKTGDMFIHLAKNDACPKTVTEALGVGMPVITTEACGGATEMSLLTEGCIVCKGDKITMEPDYVYRDEWNVLSRTVQKRILKGMIQIANDKRRVILPEELHIETTAKKYLKVMENCLR